MGTIPGSTHPGRLRAWLATLSRSGQRPLPVSVFAAEVTCPLTPPPLTAVNGANRLWLASIVSRHLTRWHEPDEYRPL